MLSAVFFKQNREQLRKSLRKPGVIVITANGLVQRNADGVYPFRQDSNLFYLTGVEEPDFLLVMDVSGGEEFLVLPKRSEAELIFGGSINCDEIAKKSGIQKIYQYDAGWDALKKLQQRRKKIYTITPPPVVITHTDSFFTNGARRRLVQRLKRLFNTPKIIDIRQHLTSLRQIKQPEELAEIEKAISITSKGIARAKKSLVSGASSYQLQAELEYEITRSGLRHAFNPIIITGEETCILHAEISGRTIKKNEPVLFDVGAESNLYSADISRTYFTDPLTKRQQAIFDAVMIVHSYALSILNPGLNWRDYAKLVEAKMGEQLIGLGLIKKIDHTEIRKFFPHGVSHSLGLDTHDVCDYKDLKENMVITVEPGIYIPEESLGIRIEDDILITKGGAKNLSVHIPYQ